MKFLISLGVVVLLICGSIYLLLSHQKPKKYVDLVAIKPTSKIVVQQPLGILFVGDIMLDRAIRGDIDEFGFDYTLSGVKEIFDKKDLVIGNLEGTITSNESISAKDNTILHFTFDPSVTPELKKYGFSGFSLANNHTLDFYQAGFDETKSNLDRVGLFDFGHPLNNQNLSKAVIVKDKKFCFLGYHSLYNASTTNVLEEIDKIRQDCDYLTVFAHWGVEYADFENDSQRDQAHSFIDRGADLVVGAHPHVIEPVEIYKNKAIFYSLGNFIFDQDFSLKTRQGIAVSLILSDKSQIFEIIPIEIYKGKLYYPQSVDFKPRIDILASELPSEVKSEFESQFRLILPR